MGEDERAFLIHKNIACDKSDFFKAACNSDWKERKEKTIRLPNTEVRTFTIFACWLYTNELDLNGTGQKPIWSTGMDAELRRNTWMDIYRCYVLGDFLNSAQFCNTLVDELLASAEATKKIPGPRIVLHFAGELRLTSTLGRLLIDSVATEVTKEVFMKNVDSYATAFVIEVAKVCVMERNMTLDERQPRNRPKCYYHEHKDEKDKCA